MTKSKSVKQPIVTALVRGLDVLRCFTESRRALSGSEIARLTGLAQPTVWRLCQTLQHYGYLTLDAADSKYRPGLPVLTLGFAAISALDLAELVRPDLLDLAISYKAAACLMTRENDSMLCVQRFEDPNAALTVSLRVGSLVPILNSGAGWGYLAGLAPAKRNDLLLHLKKADPENWRAMHPQITAAMNQYDKHGYLVNANVLYPGMTTVAVPLLRARDGEAFSVICTGMSGVLTPERIRSEIGARVKAVGEKLTIALAHNLDNRP